MGLGNRFVFPAPQASYGPESYQRNLCWIPWNSVISSKVPSEDKSPDGIPCLWFPAPRAASVILFFHANAEDLGMCSAVLKHIRDQFKVNVLAVEYPGYGLLQDMAPSEEGIHEVALTALRYLVDEVNVRYSQVILFGRSLGSGPAVYLAAQYPVGGLILVSPFTSIKAAVKSIVGPLVAWGFEERFPNAKLISNVSCATLLIHGESDGLIPADHSLQLFKRCRARKLLVTPPKMEHNSNIFGDASFLAVPAIHFFGFPGYYTSSPPRLPSHLFQRPSGKRAKVASGVEVDTQSLRPWLCDCLGSADTHHLDVTSSAKFVAGLDEITIDLRGKGRAAPSRCDKAEIAGSHRGEAEVVEPGRPPVPRSTADTIRSAPEDADRCFGKDAAGCAEAAVLPEGTGSTEAEASGRPDHVGRLQVEV